MTRFGGFLALGLLACGESSTGLPAGIPVITPTRQWSGGTVQLQGELFSSGPTQFSIIARDSTLAWQRVDDSTIAVTLPDVSSDTLSLRYDSPQGRRVLGTIEVAGFLGAIPTSQPIYAPIDRVAGQKIIGIVPVDQGFGFQVAVLDPVSGQVTIDPGMTTGGRYPGLSYRPGVVFVPKDQSLVTEVWQLFPAPTIIDTLSTVLSRIFELKPFTMLVGYNYSDPSYAAFVTSPDSGITWTFDFRSFRAPVHLHVSPAGDRAVGWGRSTSGLADPGIPVFDLATGDTAYSITAIYSLGAPEFSPDGSLLYMTGSAPGFRTDSSVVIIANAGDGTIVRYGTFPTQAMGLTLDPVRNRLLIPTEGEDCQLHLMVLNATTLAVEADLRVPAEDSPCFQDNDAPVILYRSGAPVARVIRPLGTHDPLVFTFDLLD